MSAAPRRSWQGSRFGYEPGLDHPLLVPSAGDARPNWQLEDFIRAVKQATAGRIAVLQFHGVPDTAHEWVNTPTEQFEAFMKYLAINKYRVIAMRDLAKYVDPRVRAGMRHTRSAHRRFGFAVRVQRA